MKPLHLDLAPRSPALVLYRTPLWLWPLLSFALMLVMGALWQLGTLHQQQSELQADLADTRERLAQRLSRPQRARSSAPSLTAEQAQRINAAIRQLNLPWDELIDALEGAARPQVALLELRPDAAARRLVGVAEARSPQDMIGYIERLKAQPLLTGVVLSSHQVNEEDKNHPLRFEFSATWQEVLP